MGVLVPTMDAVIEAVKTRLDTVSGLGTVITSDNPFEEDVDFIEINSHISSGSMNLFIVSAEAAPEFEGPASLEVYSRIQVIVQIWILRTGSATWDKITRDKAEAARDEISGNAAIFRIGGQVPVTGTPETVSLTDHGKGEISGDDGPQMIWKSELKFEVETRRWT